MTIWIELAVAQMMLPATLGMTIPLAVSYEPHARPIARPRRRWTIRGRATFL